MATLAMIHEYLGYLVSLVVLVTALSAFGKAKAAREFNAGPYRAAFALLTVQVLLGLVIYVWRQAWEADPLLAYVHPALAILALGVGQMLLAKARRTQMAVDAHRTAGRGLILSFLLVLGAVGVATAAAMS